MVVLAKPEKQGSSRRSSSAAASVLLVPKRNVDWVMPSDVPTDIVIEAGGTSFALHKFPLVSRRGRIRKEPRDSGPSYVRLPDIPGGEETFELVAKFCYGLNVEINPSNAALLRCAAQYLDMTDDYGDNNLISRTEAFINGVSKLDLTAGVALLHSCEALLPMAEDLKIVSTCIDAIADKACEQYSEYNDSMVVLHANSQVHRTGNVYWWAEDLAILSIGFYKRILAAVISRGLPSKSIGGILMVYAQRALKGIINKQIGREAGILHKEKLDTTVAMEEEQRAFVEAIVAMLPHEKSIIMCRGLAHPGLNEQDRKKLCKLLDVQKLSQEACAHAAQNDRLPVFLQEYSDAFCLP